MSALGALQAPPVTDAPALMVALKAVLAAGDALNATAPWTRANSLAQRNHREARESARRLVENLEKKG